MSAEFVQRGRRIKVVLRPFEEFAAKESASGLILLVCAVAAFAWANSRWLESYFHLWETPVTLGIGSFQLSKSLHHWINDGLMAVFFLLVGLEIKREVLIGELASLKQAALPIAGAVGGMLVPACLFVAINAGGPGIGGWGVPMATDIAFALGILALAGKGVPLSLKIFLTALAIVDDLGAVLVIALFYSSNISWSSLGMAGGIVLLLLMANWLGVRSRVVYSVLGLLLWFVVLKSGVHATVAGVLLALTIPPRADINISEFLERARAILHSFEKAASTGIHHYSPERQHAVHALETTCEEVETPLLRIEHALLPWVTFLIMPVFAIANAGVTLPGEIVDSLLDPVSLGVIIGLFLGKPLGILIFSWLAVKSGLAALGSGVTWHQLIGVGFLGGVGFTMSLFIATLAFGGSELLDIAKIGILSASFLSALAGLAILRFGGAAETRN